MTEETVPPFSNENPPQETGDRSIVLNGKSKFRKLNSGEIETLDLKPVAAPTIHTATDRNTGELCYLIQTSNAVLIIDKDHPYIRELKLNAINQIMNATQATTPVQIAASINRSLKEAGFKSKLDPFEALDFGIEAMGKVIEFEGLHTQLIKINVTQADLLQLKADISLGRTQYALLPKYRKIRIALLAEANFISLMQGSIDENTVVTSEHIKEISLNLEQRKSEIAKMLTEDKVDKVERIFAGGSSVAKTVITDFASAITEGSSELIGGILILALGQETVDEGLLAALLRNSGDAGERLHDAIVKSGMTVNQFITNLFGKNGENNNNVFG